MGAAALAVLLIVGVSLVAWHFTKQERKLTPMASANIGKLKQTKKRTEQEQVILKSKEPAVGKLQTGMVKQKNSGLAKQRNPKLHISKQLKQRNAPNCNKITCSFKDFTLNIIHIF